MVGGGGETPPPPLFLTKGFFFKELYKFHSPFFLPKFRGVLGGGGGVCGHSGLSLIIVKNSNFFKVYI